MMISLFFSVSRRELKAKTCQSGFSLRKVNWLTSKCAVEYPRHPCLSRLSLPEVIGARFPCDSLSSFTRKRSFILHSQFRSKEFIMMCLLRYWDGIICDDKRLAWHLKEASIVLFLSTVSGVSFVFHKNWRNLICIEKEKGRGWRRIWRCKCFSERKTRCFQSEEGYSDVDQRRRKKGKMNFREKKKLNCKIHCLKAVSLNVLDKGSSFTREAYCSFNSRES
jgi:hypothetical protein